MAVFETTRPMTVGVPSGARGFFTDMISVIVDWNDRRMTRNALSALTSRELEDIGLSRGDIANF